MGPRVNLTDISYHHNSNSMQILFCFNPNSDKVIDTNIARDITAVQLWNVQKL